MAYISMAGGGETFLHKDGKGMVDAGHYCVHGFNHVIMLRRLPSSVENYLKQLGLFTWEDNAELEVSFWH